jgi:two-component system chemotaxis response regulator CheY
MSKKIVIVDDSASIREVVKFTLENAGFDVLVGTDGSEAIEFFDGREIDLLITDLHMPQVNGIELIKMVRKLEDYQRVPILFLTTESQKDKKMEAKDAGATGWLIKPFVPQKLLAAISKVLR